MFQFTWFPLPALCVQAGVTDLYFCWVSPFGHPWINANLTTSQGLSQPITTFIGSTCQGIHRWLFVAWNSLRTSRTCFIGNTIISTSEDVEMLVLAMQFSRVANVERYAQMRSIPELGSGFAALRESEVTLPQNEREDVLLAQTVT